MATTYKREITVEITPKNPTLDAEGAVVPIVLTGDLAHNVFMQYSRGDQMIRYYNPETGTYEVANRDCICAMSESATEGDPYVKPDCEPLFCDDEEVVEP